ncbi:MAG: putative O-glycosylation ligase, exosortase A system-associated [Pseudomonadales bacterium]|nr:putative O-glycosylation ligase, exosortase A system-associated [Pseudomonadales bacterium]
MRDILITAMVFGSLLLILRKPYIGILVWSWLSYMNPHRLSWGFAYDMPFAQIVAITLFTSMLFSKDRKSIPLNSITIVWAAFLLWMTITTLVAIYPDIASLYYFRILKIQLVTFLTILLITDRVRLNQLVWVVVMSIGFFSIKGGVFTVLSGGGYRVWGPPGSFIEENNALALSTLMILPLMYYLYKISEKKWVKYFLVFAMASSFASALGSQSRGALVAIVAVGGFFWLKSSSKLVTGLLGAVVIVIGLGFMPDSWFDRMSTIQTYEEDASAMGRINAWEYSINIANDRLTGGGLKAWTFKTFSKYAPNPLDVHAAHSIYFGVLGDHGWPGLFLYLLILILTWRALSKIVKNTSGIEGASEVSTLARMVQVSLVAFFTGGAFLSLPYFDLPWFFVALTVILGRQLKEQEPGKVEALESAESTEVEVKQA